MRLENSNYNINRKWSDQFIPEIKRILGETFIIESSAFKDKNEATDLIVMELEKKCFACRVRRHWVYEVPRWKNQFTMRDKLPKYKKSEFEKILEGFGDVYFYGFSNRRDDGTGFVKYIIFDLNIFRKYIKFLKNRKHECWGKELNKDNSPDFWWFNEDCFPDEMFIKKDRLNEKKST